MTTNNPELNEYEQAERELKNAIAAANDKFAKAKSDIAGRSRLQLFNALNDAVKLYALIPDESRITVWKDEDFLKFVKELGLKPISSRKRKRKGPSPTGISRIGKPKSELVAKDVLAYISEKGKATIGEVVSHFSDKGSKPTITVRINELLAEKSITKRKADKGNSKILQLA